MAACILCDDILTHVSILMMLPVDFVVLANVVVKLRESENAMEVRMNRSDLVNLVWVRVGLYESLILFVGQIILERLLHQEESAIWRREGLRAAKQD